MGLTACPLPDDPETVAFMEGPIVLAGLCEEDRVLYGDAGHPETILIPDDERKWSSWNISYRTQNQDRNIRFIPLYDVGYEKYSVYFKVKNREAKGFRKILSKKGTSEFTLQKDPVTEGWLLPFRQQPSFHIMSCKYLSYSSLHQQYCLNQIVIRLRATSGYRTWVQRLSPDFNA